MTMWRGVLLGWAALAVAQSQVPVLRSTTDIVVVDAQVMTPSGDVISDLTQSDFTLKVDGQPRPIVNFVHEHIDAARPAKRLGTGAMTTLSTGAGVEAQSYVRVIANRLLMRPDQSKSMFEQAARFVESLPSAHAVSLWLPPDRRPLFPFPGERKAIAAELRRQIGRFGLQSPSDSEVFATIEALEDTLDEFRDLDGRKTIVFISDAMSNPDDRLRFIAQRAADADITIHTIGTDNTVQALIDTRKRLPDSQVPGAVSDTGGSNAADMLSDMTGGLTLHRANPGSVLMPRIAALLAEQYLLSFAVIAADKDGKPHHIEVSVNRSGADVRARSSFVR